MNCSICKEEIKGRVFTDKDGNQSVPYEGGNNAEPVNSGRCCDKCNMEVVIPARLGIVMGTPKCEHKNTYVAVRHESGIQLVKCSDCGRPIN